MSPGSTDSENEDTVTSSEEEPEVAEEEPEVSGEEPEVAGEEPPEDESPPQNEFDWSTDSFVPQRVGECDSSEIGEIAVQQAASLTSGKLQIEPSIVFVNETFTVTYLSLIHI